MINCGGYAFNMDEKTKKPDEDDPGSYLSKCQTLSAKGADWADAADMDKPRAFFAMATITKDVRIKSSVTASNCKY